MVMPQYSYSITVDEEWIHILNVSEGFIDIQMEKKNVTTEQKHNEINKQTKIILM